MDSDIHQAPVTQAAARARRPHLTPPTSSNGGANKCGPPLNHHHLPAPSPALSLPPDRAADFLLYFEATAPLLDADPSLWCVSSWNDNGFEKGHGWDVRGLFRTSYFPGGGWVGAGAGAGRRSRGASPRRGDNGCVLSVQVSLSCISAELKGGWTAFSPLHRAGLDDEARAVAGAGAQVAAGPLGEATPRAAPLAVWLRVQRRHALIDRWHTSTPAMSAVLGVGSNAGHRLPHLPRVGCGLQDHWMRDEEVSRGRECVCPEVNRNKNIGEVRRDWSSAGCGTGLAACGAGQRAAWHACRVVASSLLAACVPAHLPGLLLCAFPCAAGGRQHEQAGLQALLADHGLECRPGGEHTQGARHGGGWFSARCP